MAEQQSPVLPLSGMVLLLAIISAVVYQETPLQGSRPTAEFQEGLSVQGIEDVPARLWQDPFAAVKRNSIRKDDTHPSEKDISPCQSDKPVLRHTLFELFCQIKKEQRADAAATPLIVMGVMMFGGPYAESSEWRLRSRYTVVSALGRANYIPKDSEHIGFVDLLKSSSCSKENIENCPAAKLPRIIPYEWFYPADNEKHPPLLVLWLDDGAFGKYPLSRLIALQRLLQQENNYNFHFKILGPTGSSSLLTMVKEIENFLWQQPNSIKSPAQAEHSELPTDKPSQNTFAIYSPSATVSTGIAGKPFSMLEIKESLAKQFQQIGINFYRTINHDWDLALTLIDELKRRGINVICDPGEDHRQPIPNNQYNTGNNLGSATLADSKDTLEAHTDHIVLIAEWDTLYGRSLPKYFECAIAARHVHLSTNLPQTKSPIKQHCETQWIHRFSYLRGIDGQLPGKQQPRSTKNFQPTAKNNSIETITLDRKKQIERPVGRGQFDYIHRLSRQIYRLQKELQRDNKEIKAIGVLGSDVYDKLLILQALKNRFPNAIFFTTDLDARLFHPAEYEWARNLVVASSFGLQLNPQLQQDIPPFRSAYQTSLFYAALLAITHAHPGRQDLFQKLLGPAPSSSSPTQRQLSQDRLQKLLKPRIFEIGYSGPVDLSVQDSHLHVPRENPFTQPHPVYSIIALVLLSLLLYLSSDPVMNGIHAIFKGIRTHPVGSFLGVILFAAAITVLLLWLLPAIILAQGEGWWREEDPVLWFEGISIWPSELLRITAALLAFLFIRKASHDIQNSNKALTQAFLLPQQPNGQLARNVLKKTRMGILIHRWQQAGVSGQRDVTTLWQQHLALSAKWPRLKRVMLYVILFLGFGFSLMELLGYPNHPYRGDFSRWINFSVLLFSVGFMLILVFWVVDATRLCAQFIDHLSTQELPWNREKLALLSQRYQITEDYLGPVLKIRLVADQTIVISRLIIYPFIILALMIISRLSYFDNWTIPMGLIIVFLLLFLYVLICAITLERAAENARAQTRDWLMEKHIGIKGDPAAPNYRSEQLQLLIEDLRNIQRGAYVPFIQQPMVRAILLPFGGVGSIAFIEYLYSILG